MAVNRLLGRRAPPKPDPVVWVKPPKQRLSTMPAHMAKEGALLLMEAGAHAFPTLVRMAERPCAFTSDHAAELSTWAAERRARARAAPSANAKADEAAATAVVEMPQPKPVRATPAPGEIALRRRIARHLPVKAPDSLGGQALKFLRAAGGSVRFEKQAWTDATGRISTPDLNKALKKMTELGLVGLIEAGRPYRPALWALTELGAENAEALYGGGHAEEA